MFATMPNNKCAVLGCDSFGGQPRVYHRFPQNPELREKWIEALSSIDPNFEPKPNSVVCTKHFSPGDYQGALPCVEKPEDVTETPCSSQFQFRRLKKGVVPSRFFDATMELQSIIVPAIQESCLSKRETAAVKSEFVCFDKSQSSRDGTGDGSSTDDAFEIPTEEVIIKEEYVESQVKEEPLEELEQDESSVIMIDDDEDEDKEPCRLDNKAAGPPEGGWRFDVSDIGTSSDLLLYVPSEVASVVKQNSKRCSLASKKRRKNHLSDFSIGDMKNPQLAAEFYALAMSSMEEKTDLVNKNLLLHDQNKKMALKIKRLKEKIADYDICHHCKARRNTALLKSEIESETAAITSLPAEPRLAKNHPALIPKAKKSTFSGQYRIVELEYFIKLLGDMNSEHGVRCAGGKMSMVSETLAGIGGEWCFQCATCCHTKTLMTDRRAKRAKIGGPLVWLNWLQRFGPSSYVEETFDKLNVPFHYAITPDTLDVIEVKRGIFGICASRKYKNKSKKTDEDSH